MDDTTRIERPTVSRRDAFRIALGAAALAAVSGCGSTRGSAGDVEDASRELQKTLAEFDGSEARQNQLVTVARRIGYQTRAVATEHDIFRQRLDVLSRDRSKGPADLEDAITDFMDRRNAQRRELFRLQDELHAELTGDEWARITAQLADSKNAAARTSVAEG